MGFINWKNYKHLDANCVSAFRHLLDNSGGISGYGGGESGRGNTSGDFQVDMTLLRAQFEELVNLVLAPIPHQTTSTHEANSQTLAFWQRFPEGL